MTISNESFDDYVFSKQADYDEVAFRKVFAGAMEPRTVLVYCFDPRVTQIPAVVAREFGDIYPGEVVTNDEGQKVATTKTLFEVVVAGGRAVDALRSVTVAQHLFGIENIVIVHHTNCGATSFTTDGLIGAYRREHGVDLSSTYDRGSVSIEDFVTSLHHDTQMMREAAGTPSHVNIYGYLYDTDTSLLTQLVADEGSPR